jgi:hypothetical protein|tara:strand:- start:142 stop:294 length:153 start_codon:yes stop_codon:yes gene_type:complete
MSQDSYTGSGGASGSFPNLKLNKTIDLQRELCDNIRSERENEKEEICTLS